LFWAEWLPFRDGFFFFLGDMCTESWGTTMRATYMPPKQLQSAK